MIHRPRSSGRPAGFAIVSADDARHLPRDGSPRFVFRVPAGWRAPAPISPHAQDAEREVIDWLLQLGCSEAEVARARRFDIAGYVGLPFPSFARDVTVRLAKYLSLWLLWDDVEVENRRRGWSITGDQVVDRERPSDLTRFDEGWWQLMAELRERRSPAWVRALCDAMAVWSATALAEATAMERRRVEGTPPSFAEQLEMRMATIGMYATLRLAEDARDFELPHEVHAHPTVQRLATLSNKIVGLGNDILSFSKDHRGNQINLVSTLMHEQGIRPDDALAAVIEMHNSAMEEFDRLALTAGGWSPEVAPSFECWLQDARHASLGFSLWEARAPRYATHVLVIDGRVIAATFPAR